MISRILEKEIKKLPKSLLLLGPRQVGKSTLLNSLNPDLSINLTNEKTYTQHLKDKGLLERIVEASPESKLILIDEIQRIPSLLNTVQYLIDSNPDIKFLLTGSSARKLKRGQANLLPGRIFQRKITPLNFWELKDNFNLDIALNKGLLPEIYLKDYGLELLESYVAGYLKEEIQAEALTKDLGAYSRFLDLAAELSGKYLNYSKVASDSEINKETVRRYFDILVDTLIVEKIPCYTNVPKQRKPRQKDRFMFFDIGVRNVLVKRHKSILSPEERGTLFEHFLTLQLISYKYSFNKSWEVKSYEDSGIEVDLIIETGDELIAIEIKLSTKVNSKMFKNLNSFSKLTNKPVRKYLVYRGEFVQKFDSGFAFPYEKFLDEIVPNI